MTNLKPTPNIPAETDDRATARTTTDHARRGVGPSALRRWALSCLVLLAAVAMTGLASAKPPPKDGRRAKIEARMQQVVERLLKDDVGLDDAKAKKVAELLKQNRADQGKLRAEMRKSRQAVKKLVDADSNDDKAYAKALAAMRKAQADQHKLTDQHFQKLSRELTPKQQAKLFVALQKLKRKLRRGMARHRDD